MNHLDHQKFYQIFPLIKSFIDNDEKVNLEKLELLFAKSLLFSNRLEKKLKGINFLNEFLQNNNKTLMSQNEFREFIIE